MQYYTKDENGKFTPVGPKDYESFRFMSNGIWLVQMTPAGSSKECILKLGELPELYPFAQMVMSKQTALKFILDFREKNNNYSFNTLVLELLKFLHVTVREENVSRGRLGKSLTLLDPPQSPVTQPAVQPNSIN